MFVAASYRLSGPVRRMGPESAFRKGLRQPSGESPALPPVVYWESRDQYRFSTRSRITSGSRPNNAQHAWYEKAFEQSFGDSSQSRISTRVAAQTLESNRARSDLCSRRLWSLTRSSSVHGTPSQSVAARSVRTDARRASRSPSAMDRDSAITSSRGAYFATPTIALAGEAVSVNAALRLR